MVNTKDANAIANILDMQLQRARARGANVADILEITCNIAVHCATEYPGFDLRGFMSAADTKFSTNTTPVEKPESKWVAVSVTRTDAGGPLYTVVNCLTGREYGYVPTYSLLDAQLQAAHLNHHKR